MTRRERKNLLETAKTRPLAKFSLDSDFDSQPEFILFRDHLGLDETICVWLIVKLIQSTARHYSNGDWSGVAPQRIISHLGWRSEWGDPTQLLNALFIAHYIEAYPLNPGDSEAVGRPIREGGVFWDRAGFRVIDWARRQPGALRRVQDRVRKARQRKRFRMEMECESDPPDVAKNATPFYDDIIGSSAKPVRKQPELSTSYQQVINILRPIRKKLSTSYQQFSPSYQQVINNFSACHGALKPEDDKTQEVSETRRNVRRTPPPITPPRAINNHRRNIYRDPWRGKRKKKYDDDEFFASKNPQNNGSPICRDSRCRFSHFWLLTDQVNALAAVFNKSRQEILDLLTHLNRAMQRGELDRPRGSSYAALLNHLKNGFAKRSATHE